RRGGGRVRGGRGRGGCACRPAARPQTRPPRRHVGGRRTGDHHTAVSAHGLGLGDRGTRRTRRPTNTTRPHRRDGGVGAQPGATGFRRGCGGVPNPPFVGAGAALGPPGPRLGPGRCRVDSGNPAVHTFHGNGDHGRGGHGGADRGGTARRLCGVRTPVDPRGRHREASLGGTAAPTASLGRGLGGRADTRAGGIVGRGIRRGPGDRGSTRAGFGRALPTPRIHPHHTAVGRGTGVRRLGGRIGTHHRRPLTEAPPGDS